MGKKLIWRHDGRKIIIELPVHNNVPKVKVNELIFILRGIIRAFTKYAIISILDIDNIYVHSIEPEEAQYIYRTKPTTKE